MSNELESKRAMVVLELWWRFRVIGADGASVQVGYSYYCETETESPHRLAKFRVDKPAVKIMFQVTQIVRFLLASERGLRHGFRNLTSSFFADMI